jgi:hypothetical protein
MAGKKIKLAEQAISEILIADTDSESGNEAGNVEEYFEEDKEGEGEEEEQQQHNNNNQPPQKSNHRLQQVADYQPGDRLKEGTQILILDRCTEHFHESVKETNKCSRVL